MGYLNGRVDLGLCFGGGAISEVDMVYGYVASDFAGSLDSRKSQSGYIYFVFDIAVSWIASLQPVVAL